MFHKKWCGSSGLPRFRIFRKSFLVQSIPQFRPFGLLTRFITASSLRRTRDLHARKKNRTENDRNFHNNELMKLNCSNSRQRLFVEANGMMYRLASSFPFFFPISLKNVLVQRKFDVSRYRGHCIYDTISSLNFI